MATSSSSSLPDPSLPAPPLSNDDEGFTADQLIARQRQLEQAALEAVPFSFAKGGCTYERGYIRQPVFACRTCGGGGVCAGCSVGCHATHDLVELFAKRSFRCDCGTLSICRGNEEKEKSILPCSLRSKDLIFAPQNDNNTYGKNFEGEFCRCERGKTYNPETEEETMFQCLCCEDWIHESCSSLRPSKAIDDINSVNRQLADGPLVEHEAFELFICDECVRAPGNEALKLYVGHRGWIVCLPTGNGQYLPDAVDDIPAITVEAKGQGWSHLWNVYGLMGGQSVGNELVEETSSLPKRKATEAEEQVGGEEINGPETKRVKTENGLQILDTFSDASQEEKEGDVDQIVVQDDDIECTGGIMPLFAAPDAKTTRLDIFLTESFRDRICRCKSCLLDFTNLPFLLEAEETYSPPRSQSSSQIGGGGGGGGGNSNDDDAQSEGGASHTSSTYDLGLAALQRLPRAQMLESLEAYNKMRDALFTHLRPFAQEGRVVDGESMREFFRKQRENDSSPSK